MVFLVCGVLILLLIECEMEDQNVKIPPCWIKSLKMGMSCIHEFILVLLYNKFLRSTKTLTKKGL